MRGIDRRRCPFCAGRLRSGHDPGHQADGGRFDITFDASDLAGKPQGRARLHPQLPIEKPGRVDEGVAVQPAKPGKLRLFKARNRLEDAHLLGIFQFRLEADHVVERAKRVVLAKLDHRVRTAAVMRIRQSHRLHRPEAKRLVPARGHDLDRHAPFEIGGVFLPFAKAHLLAVQKRLDKTVILRLVHRAVDIVLAVAAIRGFVVA